MRKGLSKQKVAEIRNIYSTTKRTMKDIGNEYGVTATSIMRFCKDIKCDNKNRGTGKKEQYNAWTKLTKYQVKKMLTIYIKGGVTQKQLAKQFNIHQSTISNICRGKSWKHLFQKLRPYNKEELKIKKHHE